MGTAPLEDPTFRAAVFEQLGESRLEGAVTTDVCGRKESHAIRLDAEAEETLRKAQVHKKTATSIFFESNGGQNPAKGAATLPEIRLAVAEPEIDIGNVETALEALADACYYLSVERNQYRFSLRENLNKRFADRRATVKDEEIEQTVRGEIQKVFAAAEGAERVFFPEKSAQVADRPALTLAIVGPDHALQDDQQVMQRLDAMTRESGTTSRVFKSALLWIVPESAAPMREEARRLQAWSAIADEGLALDEVQAKQLQENMQKAKRDLREAVWRAYKNVVLLGPDNRLKTVDLGPVHSSAAESVSKLVLHNLRQTGDIEKDISPRFLVRNWPGMTEWSTKAVRDAFFASPQFPRLLRSETVREAIACGGTDGTLAYVGRKPDGTHDPFDPKERQISVAPFRDRVLHHALMSLCEPVFERYAVHDTYACRKGKGSHRAVARAQAHSRRFAWFVKLDVRRYYDSVDHGILFRLLCRRFKDPALLMLFQRLIGSYETAPGRGLPIGNLTSQHFANYYLGLLDHWVKEDRCVAVYVRYMDDFVLWADSKAELKRLVREVREFLAAELALELKHQVLINDCGRGTPFLGYRVFPDRILLSRRSRARFARKLASCERDCRTGKLTEACAGRRVEALVSWTRFAAAAGFRRHVLHSSRTGQAYAPGVEAEGLVQGLEPGDPGRQLEQQRQELSLSDAQLEHAGQPEQHHRFPPGSARSSRRAMELAPA